MPAGVRVPGAPRGRSQTVRPRGGVVVCGLLVAGLSLLWCRGIFGGIAAPVALLQIEGGGLAWSLAAKLEAALYAACLLALLAWAAWSTSSRPSAAAKGSSSDNVRFTHVFTKEHRGNVHDHYQLDKDVLGEGAFGTVCRGVDKVTLAERAVKAITISKIENKEMFEREIEISQGLDHPNIVKLHEVVMDSHTCYLVMDLCTGGELFDRIIEQTEKNDGTRAFTEGGAATYMKQILGAINYLHFHRVVHRDLKPENFLLTSKAPDAEIKVIDFGVAKRLPAEGKSVLTTKVGSLWYFSPQVMQRRYDEKCDVWSCGVIAYILLCGYPPFRGDSKEQTLRKIQRGKFRFPSPEWYDVSESAKDFICQMLTFDPNRRPSAEEMLSHEWLLASDSPKSRISREISRDLGNRLRQFTTASKIKKAALSVIAQQMGDEQIRELRTTFQALDTNLDGMLTVVEIREGMKENRMRIPRDLEQLIENLDTDGSGMIDYTEFIASTLTRKEYLRDDMMWSAFRVFDQDGDGSITKGELMNVLKLVDGELTEQMVSEVDANGDGEICFDEFCTLLRQNSGRWRSGSLCSG